MRIQESDLDLDCSKSPSLNGEIKTRRQGGSHVLHSQKTLTSKSSKIWCLRKKSNHHVSSIKWELFRSYPWCHSIHIACVYLNLWKWPNWTPTIEFDSLPERLDFKLLGGRNPKQASKVVQPFFWRGGRKLFLAAPPSKFHEKGRPRCFFAVFTLPFFCYQPIHHWTLKHPSTFIRSNVQKYVGAARPGGDVVGSVAIAEKYQGQWKYIFCVYRICAQMLIPFALCFNVVNAAGQIKLSRSNVFADVHVKQNTSRSAWICVNLYEFVMFSISTMGQSPILGQRGPFREWIVWSCTVVANGSWKRSCAFCWSFALDFQYCVGWRSIMVHIYLVGIWRFMKVLIAVVILRNSLREVVSPPSKLLKPWNHPQIPCLSVLQSRV